MDLPCTEQGNRHFIVLQDMFTKWPLVFPVPDQKTERIAKLLCDEIDVTVWCTLSTTQGPTCYAGHNYIPCWALRSLTSLPICEMKYSHNTTKRGQTCNRDAAHWEASRHRWGNPLVGGRDGCVSATKRGEPKRVPGASGRGVQCPHHGLLQEGTEDERAVETVGVSPTLAWVMRRTRGWNWHNECTFVYPLYFNSLQI